MLCFGLVKERWLAGPAFIGESSQFLYLRLADEVLLLFFDARRLIAGVSEPLMPLSYSFGRLLVTYSFAVYGVLKQALARQARTPPSNVELTRDLNIGIMCSWIEFDNATESDCISSGFELPESVTSQVLA